MLSKISSGVSQTVSTEKQIVLNSSTPNAVVYTVPAGRKFVGSIFNTSYGQYYLLNDNSVYTSMNTGTGGSVPIESACSITLLAGTVVKVNSTPHQVCILGVEYDA